MGKGINLVPCDTCIHSKPRYAVDCTQNAVNCIQNGDYGNRIANAVNAYKSALTELAKESGLDQGMPEVLGDKEIGTLVMHISNLHELDKRTAAYRDELKTIVAELRTKGIHATIADPISVAEPFQISCPMRKDDGLGKSRSDSESDSGLMEMHIRKVEVYPAIS